MNIHLYEYAAARVVGLLRWAVTPLSRVFWRVVPSQFSQLGQLFNSQDQDHRYRMHCAHCRRCDPSPENFYIHLHPYFSLFGIIPLAFGSGVDNNSEFRQGSWKLIG